jgi:hypothetical protein
MAIDEEARELFKTIKLPINGREVGPFTYYLACYRAVHHRLELGARSVRTAEIALQALERIEALLDDDCDETRVALYNPKATVGNIRRELEQAQEDLTAAERAANAPHAASAPALAPCPNCGKPFQPNDGIGGEACCAPAYAALPDLPAAERGEHGQTDRQVLERIAALVDAVNTTPPYELAASVRRALEQARRAEGPEPAETELEIADSALRNMPRAAVRERGARELMRRLEACERVAHDPDHVGGRLDRLVGELAKLGESNAARLVHLERPIADRDAIAWEIGRSAGIRGDAPHLNPFRRPQ